MLKIRSMENIAETIGHNLSALRKAKGLTQRELALYINYSDKSISKWEKGYSVPSIDVLKDFADYYGVTVDYLISPKSDDDLKNVVKQKESNGARSRKGTILAMSAVVVFLIALSIFLSDYYLHPTENPINLLWPVFFFAVPASLLIAAGQTHFFYHNKIAVTTLLSATVWTLLLAFCFTYSFFVDAEFQQNIWYILFIGVPLQVIFILVATYHRDR